MSMSAIGTIVQREIKDTLTDWRILLPIFILTIILPQLIIAPIRIAIQYVGDVSVIIRLIPFMMLLIGFIPASFSLIAALETFVGERERNSLEALLSMPISDNTLYLGKLISALLPPLMSALMAMTVFTLTLRVRFPDLFAEGLTFEYFVVVVMLITVKALVMVAAAVIISSHTTSIRAANLLASFVLLPTATMVQLEALLMIGQRWDMLWQAVIFLGVVAIALIRTGIGAFNREEILSREHEQLNLKHVNSTFRLFLREYQPAGFPPDMYTGEPFTARRFYLKELPALLREYRLALAVALLSALGGLALGGYIGQTYQVVALDRVLDAVGSAPDPGLRLVLFVFFNNLRVTLLSSVFSLFVFGAFSFLVPAVAFAQIGFVSSTLMERGGSWFALGDGSPLQFMLSYVIPHGIIELPAALLCAAMGIRIGASLMSPPKGFSVGQNILWSLAQFFKVWLLVVLPMILLGSLIEGLISPLVVRALYT